MSHLIPIDEVAHFDVCTHVASTGAVSDADSAPTFSVYEEDTDTAILGPTSMTKRTSLTGNYRGSFTASAANGFEAGKWYSVIVSATVSTIAAKTVAMHFRVAPAESSAGVPKSDVSHFGGTAGTFSGGRPEVNTTHAAGTAWGSGAITAASIAADAITAAKIADGAIDAATFAAGAINAAAIAADAITDAKVASDVTIASVTGAVGSVTGNVGGSVASIASGGITASSFSSGAIDAAAIATDAITSAELAATATAEIAAAVRTELATELGRIDVATSTRLASASYTAPLDAAGTRAAVGLASANLDTQLAAIDDYLDTEIAAIKAKTDNLPSDPADASDIAASFSTVNSTLSTIAGYIDTEVAAILAAVDTEVGAIKAKTDNLPASPAATSDIPTVGAIADAVWDEAISGHAVSGSTGEALAAAGAAGDPWITALPGSYSSGQAGYIVGTALDAAVSSRASQTSLNTLDDYVDTEVAAIKAKTDLIPASPAAVSDIPTATQNADALLNRDMSAVSDTNSRSPLNAFRFLRNKWSLSGTTLTVTEEDDSTTAWTATVTTNAGADPITGSDPA